MDILIVGKTGQGKSYFAKMLIKKIMEKKRVVIVDDNPEYADIPNFQWFTVGREHAFKEINFDKMFDKWLYVGFEVVDLLDDEQNFFINQLSDAVWNRGNTCLIIDEAHKFYPKWRYPANLARLIKGGRKFNIDVIMVTQMLNELDLSMIRQAHWIVSFQVTEYNEVKRLAHYFKGYDTVLQNLKFTEFLIADMRRGVIGKASTKDFTL